MKQSFPAFGNVSTVAGYAKGLEAGMTWGTAKGGLCTLTYLQGRNMIPAAPLVRTNSLPKCLPHLLPYKCIFPGNGLVNAEYQPLRFMLSKSFSSVKGEWTKVQEWLQANAENTYVAGTSDRDAHAMICGKLLRGDYPSFKTEKGYTNIECMSRPAMLLPFPLD